MAENNQNVNAVEQGAGSVAQTVPGQGAPVMPGPVTSTVPAQVDQVMRAATVEDVADATHNEDLAAHEIFIQKQIKSKTPEAEQTIALYKEIFLESPLEVLQVVDDKQFGQKFREDTKKELDRLSHHSVDGLFERIKPERDRVLHDLRAQFDDQKYIAKYKAYCKLADVKVDQALGKYDKAKATMQQMSSAKKVQNETIHSLQEQIDQSRIDHIILQESLDAEREANAELRTKVAQLNEDNRSASAKPPQLETELQQAKSISEQRDESIKELNEQLGSVQVERDLPALEDKNQQNGHPTADIEVLDLRERFGYNPNEKTKAKARPKNALKRGIKPTWTSGLPLKRTVHKISSNDKDNKEEEETVSDQSPLRGKRPRLMDSNGRTDGGRSALEELRAAAEINASPILYLKPNKRIRMPRA
ncbi:MAG: hypothetical protein LQ338_007222 [Usnochroma carphineum]|nr:MAG: hypothetical protein LQ338_007222 [Usnochroma carphineum]